MRSRSAGEPETMALALDTYTPVIPASRQPAPFNVPAQRTLAGQYTVIEKIGNGWEGEVYRVEEVHTGVPRALKLFYPERGNPFPRAQALARQLCRLRHCHAVVQYHTAVAVRIARRRTVALVSDLIEGKRLSVLLAEQRGRRLPCFDAIHLLYALVRGLEEIHHAGAYHGDLHDDNVLVSREGIHYRVKLLDLYHHGRTTRELQFDDLVGTVHLFHLALGGQRHYARQPVFVKAICKGLRRDLLKKAFPTAASLRQHLESFEW